MSKTMMKNGRNFKGVGWGGLVVIYLRVDEWWHKTADQSMDEADGLLHVIA